MQKTLSILFSIMFMSTALISYSAFAKADKIGLCHNTGNGGYVVIVVSVRALVAHLQHQDRLIGEGCDQPLPQ